MVYRVEFKPSAQDALGKIPLSYRRRIAKKIEQLAENPRPHNSEKLEGATSLYRVRIGEYRVVYQIQDEALQVLVVRIGNRGDVYRHLS